MSFTQYISANTQGITMVSAEEKNTVVNATSQNTIFHITMNAVDGASIETAMQFKLKVALYSNDTGDTVEIIVNSSQPEEGVFKYFYKKKNGEEGFSLRTVDKNDIFPLQLIHGDLYFSIPKTKQQKVVAHIVEFSC